MNVIATKSNTLEGYLQRMPLERLMDIEQELLANKVPATGVAHSEIRHINNMIDRGDLCINPLTYRRVYLPTFARAVHKEMASRYYIFTMGHGGYYVESNN